MAHLKCRYFIPTHWLNLLRILSFSSSTVYLRWWMRRCARPVCTALLEWTGCRSWWETGAGLDTTVLTAQWMPTPLRVPSARTMPSLASNKCQNASSVLQVCPFNRHLLSQIQFCIRCCSISYWYNGISPQVPHLYIGVCHLFSHLAWDTCLVTIDTWLATNKSLNAGMLTHTSSFICTYM